MGADTPVLDEISVTASVPQWVKLLVLAPWIALAAAIIAGATIAIRHRTHG